MTVVPDEHPWVCHQCGARTYDPDGWGINADYTLYCDTCEETT